MIKKRSSYFLFVGEMCKLLEIIELQIFELIKRIKPNKSNLAQLGIKPIISKSNLLNRTNLTLALNRSNQIYSLNQCNHSYNNIMLVKPNKSNHS